MRAAVSWPGGLAVGLVVVACSNDLTTPPGAFCPTMTPPLVLSVGRYTAVDPGIPRLLANRTLACIVFAANPSSTDAAEYLLVPQATTETPDLSSSFKLVGSAAVAAAPALSASLQSAAPLSSAQRFHDRLRQLERTGAYGSAGLVGASGVRATVAVGDTGRFKVLNTLTGLTVDMVTATAKQVGQHIAIFIDTGAPRPGLSVFDLDTLRAVFDTQLYAADTAAFGRESDVDGNGLVIVLLTNTVNKMSTQCASTGSYVAGFFFGGDIDPVFRSRFNSAEIFYAIVPDSLETLSCQHKTSDVKLLVPSTFVHEVQHMISYNQHVLLRRGSAEVLWLNEGMSHYAEELGGRTFLTSNDSASFCRYVRGDLQDAVQYLQALGSHPLVDTAGIGGIAERGAWWLFVRYLVDQFGQDTSRAAANAFTRKIDQTSLLGTANVSTQTGVPFATLVERWALANWVSDLPGFTPPAELTYKKWAFRSAYAAVSRWCGSPLGFPLVAPAAAPADVNLSGRMWSGTGAAYQRVLQAPGDAGFRLGFGDSAGVQLPGALEPRLNVIRIR